MSENAHCGGAATHAAVIWGVRTPGGLPEMPWGRVPHGRAVTRRINPACPVELWISGPLGDGNLAAVGGTTRALSGTARRNGQVAQRSCGGGASTRVAGLWDAMGMLAQLNPEFRLELDLEAVPLADNVTAVCRTEGLSPWGGSLSVARGSTNCYLQWTAVLSHNIARNFVRMGAVSIGRARPDPEPGFFCESQRVIALATRSVLSRPTGKPDARRVFPRCCPDCPDVGRNRNDDEHPRIVATATRIASYAIAKSFHPVGDI